MRFYIIFYTLFLFASCDISTVESNKDILLLTDTQYLALSEVEAKDVKKKKQLLGLVEFSENERMYERTWHIIEDSLNQIQLSIPNNWKIEERDKSLLYAKIDNEDGFFIIVAHDRKLHDLNLNQYVDYFMSVMRNDTEEKLFWSNFNGERNKNGLFDITLATDGKEGKSFFHSYLFEYKNYVFEVTMKFKNESDINLYKTIHEKIIGGLYIYFVTTQQ